MKRLILLRGIPGSGKSTFVAEHKLEPYTLSADNLRMIFGSPTLDLNGKLRISQENDNAVWRELTERLRQRMARGELVVIDATHANQKSFHPYESLIKRYGYRTFCVDFADVPYETCLARNAARAENDAYRIVPDDVMEKMQTNLERAKFPRWITAVKPDEFDEAMKFPLKDVSKYKKIHHFGDIQGCFDPLNEYFTKNGIQDDELYIFVGDYLDRGPKNAETMNWFLEHRDQQNFIFIEGNHEAHLRTWSQGVNSRSSEFADVTAPQLEAAGITPKQVFGFLYRLRDAYLYGWNGKIVLITHGGLSTLPENLMYINSRQLIHGVGGYDDADQCDQNFDLTAPDNAYQVHGHRNRADSPTFASQRCFNLEGKVEFAGELRIVTLDETGWQDASVKSLIDMKGLVKSFSDSKGAGDSEVDSTGDSEDDSEENSASDSAKGSSENIGVTAGQKGTSIQSVTDLIESFRASEGVREKRQHNPHVSSFNFTRDVFYNKLWDDLNVHARGIFINTKTNQIIARAYEKFFNVGERPETEEARLLETLQFPVSAYVKENGYLGLIGYDDEKADFVFASKSTTDGDYARWIKVQFDVLAPLKSEVRETVRKYLAVGKTLVFEVIEPKNDPHIIEYAEPQLVLLDIVHNKIQFQADSAQEREQMAELLGVRAKERAAVLKNAEELFKWLTEVKNFDYQYTFKSGRTDFIEGFVLEDASGFNVKIKLPWYAFWRQMRTLLERVKSGLPINRPYIRNDVANSETNLRLADDFVNFIEGQDVENLKQLGIIELRKQFNNR